MKGRGIMGERIAVVDGVRSPFCRAGVVLKKVSADDLGVHVVKELLARTSCPINEVDELIFGNAAQPANAANIARVIALKSGLPKTLSAYTVHRNCASGLESVTTAASKIRAGEGSVYVVGGTESMSNIPLYFNGKMTTLFVNLMKSKTIWQKSVAIAAFRPSFLSPVIAVQEGLTDPVSGLNMGMTAENLATEFHITREEQDQYAMRSHQLSAKARDNKIFEQEIHPLPVPDKYEIVQEHDDGIRKEQTLEALANLKPYFDRATGTVTVGNACGLTDGSCAILLTSETKAKQWGIKPLGYLKEYAYAGLEPERMGLGPVYSASKVLDKAKMTMNHIELFELNEAFAAQVIANEKAFDSDDFAKKYLGKSSKVGFLDRNKLNVNGGAIALGHPVGATGARLIVTLLKEMKRKNVALGMATLCIGGGQGAALILELE
jgi:acetyl-CoA acyltransferase